jgi:hypothetical protein
MASLPAFGSIYYHTVKLPPLATSNNGFEKIQIMVQMLSHATYSVEGDFVCCPRQVSNF